METILFQDRADATEQLIRIIPPLEKTNAIVLGIPRGGVPMAATIAKRLHLPVDVLLVRKLSTPFNPEYAIGAVSLEKTWIDEKSSANEVEIDRSIPAARSVLQERNKLYRQNKPFPTLTGKTVLLVDDGIATGRTLLHAIEICQEHQPQAIWVGVPVSSRDAASRIQPKVDRFLCLHQPDPFIGVGQFYKSFPSVSDKEVVDSLQSNDR
jgi:putative phosphoribosyl transferase